jgi:acyl-ACP thioesterase
MSAEMKLDPGMAGAEARPVDGVDNGFAAGYRVRFDEAGPDGLVRTSTLLRYAQDVAWRHSEALGFDRRWYADRRLAWVVRAVALELLEPIAMGETVRVSTAVVGHRRIWARRLGAFISRAGTRAAAVTTDWVLLDARNRIVRIPDDFGVAFTNPEIRAEILRVEPTDAAPVATVGVPVRTRDLDPMGHVNNAVYLDWAEEALQAAGWTPATGARWARLEYLASAGPADEVELEVGGAPGDWSVRIRRADGTDLVRVAGGAFEFSAG